MVGRTAWVIGATGLVGNALVKQLAQTGQYGSICAMVRRVDSTKWTDLAAVSQQEVDFSNIEKSLSDLSVDEVYCAIGTTAKKTPDPEKYYEIDVEYPLKFAELGLSSGMTYYGLVSAHGASSKSFSSYLKMKGLLEDQLVAMPIPQIAIARPGLLTGDRQEKRLGEQTFEHVAKFLPGNYKSIRAEDVAAALINASRSECPQQILSSKSMQGSSRK